ncbi:CRISPR-associated protein Cas2 [Candidatus Kryptonium thompsonii]|uniref:CRISPR-associated endoribonuclease Cas2 n=1 Tax=Candidatus Kryptonium thompsonii TaxID=1633631 RepID=A0A0P1LRZ3_9BACT|nr:CRISPR-associated endonuclease Cas2 [Candidatus Kryptonium thompsoni]CUS77389.1 CRISPR-associated protein Cas2 [Candidatus Kryptonium thompsoni]CUS79580.1 CRISPR-associated protein Cas2 [Candidatus Kryptonium thompsoni]CUS84548.1 CRISPR-associated protein Cas2 [Candidatus Kryptonium thompsoni]CUS89648.1 CRISPR-associated protein Cas2 [Candidatus Kryptonium thompsoni]CUS89964.1 CRISPR-associated protein Cas2 [Candidatus Kryptonium thompsoni]
MYYIVVYDIAEKRVNKVLKFMRKYLNWVQNSVFEGELSDGQFEEMKVKLRKIINLNEDSVLIYSMEKKWVDREVIGVERSEVSRII